MKKFVLATANQGKVKEMRSILSAFGIECVSRDEVVLTLKSRKQALLFLKMPLLKQQKFPSFRLWPPLQTIRD